MIEAVNQIRSHLDLIDSAYKLVKFVLPENAVKCCHRAGGNFGRIV